MLVDVVELRLKGEKRPKEEVQAATPVRGVLSLSPARPGWHAGKHNAPLLAGLVAVGQTRWALEPLDLARVTVIRDFALLIVGAQEFNATSRYRDRVKVYPQAWWCRVVQDGVTTEKNQGHYAIGLEAQRRPTAIAGYRDSRHASPATRLMP